jgi:hypothetical protein
VRACAEDVGDLGERRALLGGGQATAGTATARRRYHARRSAGFGGGGGVDGVLEGDVFAEKGSSESHGGRKGGRWESGEGGRRRRRAGAAVVDRVMLGVSVNRKRASPGRGAVTPGNRRRCSEFVVVDGAERACFWYSVTRPSKKFCSFLMSIISASQGSGFDGPGDQRIEAAALRRRRSAM